MFKTPILFLTYKRYETAKKVFDEIKKIKPDKLYFASNSPNINIVDDYQKVLNVRSLINEINWDCEVKTLFREEHLTVKDSISSSIDWFFENEESGIILEDDCLPSESFFKFCHELLYLYKDDFNVMSIGGTSLTLFETKYSYYFSRRVHIWGWATWRRAWNKYDKNIQDWPLVLQDKKSFFHEIPLIERKFWREIFDLVYYNKLITWDYQWEYKVRQNKSFSIIPCKNLIKNIGFSPEAHFTKDINSIESKLKYFELDFPLVHPEKYYSNKKAEKFTVRSVVKISHIKNLINSSIILKKIYLLIIKFINK
jgi:hypothetical protein